MGWDLDDLDRPRPERVQGPQIGKQPPLRGQALAQDAWMKHQNAAINGIKT